MATYIKSITAFGAVYTNGSSDLDGSGGSDTLVAGDVIQFDNSGGDHIGYQTFIGYTGDDNNHIIINLNGVDVDCQDNGGWTGINLVDCDNITVIANGGVIKNVASGVYAFIAREGTFTLIGVETIGGSQGIAIHNDEAVGEDYINHRDDYVNGIGNKKITLLNCNVSQTSLEGVYIGPSNTHKIYQLSTDKSQLYEQPLVGEVLIDGCTVTDCGNDGIQVSGNKKIIRNCNISNFGKDNNEFGNNQGHCNGIQDGPYGYSYIYNNYVDGYGLYNVGIATFGSVANVFNNTVKDCQDGLVMIFTKEEYLGGVKFLQNTVVDTARYGFVTYNPVSGENYSINNIFHMKNTVNGTTVKYTHIGANLGAGITEQDVIKDDTAQFLIDNFVDAVNDDYRLKVGSIAIDSGESLLHYNSMLLFDANVNQRSITGPWSAGAYKREGS